MSPIRKEALKRLGFMALGVIVMILSGNKGIGRTLGIVGFLFAMLQFILLVPKSQLLIDDFFPPKVSEETKASGANKTIYTIGMCLFFGALIAIIFESNYIGNTIHGTRFFWISAAIGIVFFTIIIGFLKLKFNSVFDESSRRFSVYFGYLFGLFLFIPAIASFINVSFSDTKTECTKSILLKKNTAGSRGTSYYIFCNVDSSKERFQVFKPFWDKLSPNDTLLLYTKKGFFGYKYVTEIKENQMK